MSADGVSTFTEGGVEREFKQGELWWDIVPIGAVLEAKDVWEGKAIFVHENKRYAVDLWDDTVAVT